MEFVKDSCNLCGNSGSFELLDGHASYSLTQKRESAAAQDHVTVQRRNVSFSHLRSTQESRYSEKICKRWGYSIGWINSKAYVWPELTFSNNKPHVQIPPSCLNIDTV